MGSEIDAFDRQLLQLVQEDAGQTAQEMSELVPLSVSAIQRRLKRLRDEGFIQRQVAVVDPQSIPGATLFIASLKVSRERPAPMAGLREWLAARPEVQQAYYVTGGDDFVVIVCAGSVASYEALMAGLMADNPDVARYTTSVVLAPVKRSLSIPVSFPADPRR